MEINFKTIKEYLEERYHRAKQQQIGHEEMYFYYDLRGRVAAVEENNMITMYYEAPQDIVETPYGRLSVSVIDNFKIAENDKTSLINALYITPILSNRNYIEIINDCIIQPDKVFEIYKRSNRLGTVGILEQDEENKYHLTNDDFDIEFKNKKFLEPNSIENFRIMVLKEIKTSEDDNELEKINIGEVYDYYYDYLSRTIQSPFDLLHLLRPKEFKTYDMIETPIVTKTEQKTTKKVKQYTLK